MPLLPSLTPSTEAIEIYDLLPLSFDYLRLGSLFDFVNKCKIWF